jgi:hypothetical protein
MQINDIDFRRDVQNGTVIWLVFYGLQGRFVFVIDGWFDETGFPKFIYLYTFIFRESNNIFCHQNTFIFPFQLEHILMKLLCLFQIGCPVRWYVACLAW